MESFIPLALIILFLAYIFGFFKKAKPQFKNPTDHFEWPSNGRFAQEVVGEGSYTKALNKIKKVMDKNNLKVVDAFLHPEDSNPHDSKAIAVVIAENLIGYLPRDEARKLRSQIQSKQLENEVTSCKAKIFGGTPDKPNFGVWLDLTL